MFLSVRRPFLLFICIGLLAFRPHDVYGFTSAGLVLRRGAQDQPLMTRNHRMLKKVDTNSFRTDKNRARLNKTSDPNQASKRKVRRGSDPIHNRT
ncbi:UNVERIFIED_CONTAM: CLAVATA3/ESR (CLE)-related protein 45 [Sesamum angustifolium]|uniref:CLAVATA3/ESR (CLE)-related protein 45 n=1 Tax=Sesamum angustifolium TaxID=2727405 RepID=A0AAW2Q8S7_9LAMI